MSATDSTLSSQGHDIAPDVHLVTLLPLNDLFKESMRQAQVRCGTGAIALRCEPLPIVRGNREEMIQLFDALAGSIFSARPTGSKFFLHVDCTQADEAAGDGFREVQIRFHTNITSDAAWRKANEAALANCTRILTLHGAGLAVREVKDNGCLFSITIPGKFQ